MNKLFQICKFGAAIGSGLERACSDESFEIRLNPPNTALSLRQTVHPL